MAASQNRPGRPAAIRGTTSFTPAPIRKLTAARLPGQAVCAAKQQQPSSVAGDLSGLGGQRRVGVEVGNPARDEIRQCSIFFATHTSRGLLLVAGAVAGRILGPRKAFERFCPPLVKEPSCSARARSRCRLSVRLPPVEKNGHPCLPHATAGSAN
jgi:hypothetical protein